MKNEREKRVGREVGFSTEGVEKGGLFHGFQLQKKEREREREIRKGGKHVITKEKMSENR